jgi:2-polyprenyl-3-methyl-5-hydroxy-6-metoxy-1,4-benzoquinol methylase
VKHRYEYEIDPAGRTAPARVVRMVGPGTRVLEIGAGPGSIARVLKERNHCHVSAVEIDSEAIAILAPYCDEVFQRDLNDTTWTSDVCRNGRYDVVVAADVLEHLYDPWAALRSINDVLKPDGYVVASIPHLGHNALIACLLAEDFEYRESGLLDRTHIRFFGIRNIQRLFNDAGFAIFEAEFVIVPPSDTEFVASWLRLRPSLRKELEANPFGTVFQVVLKAQPSAKPEEGLSLVSIPTETPAAVAFDGSEETTTRPVVERPSSAEPSGWPRLIAFYLPQFHPIPENDTWWGKGFTEWRNVTRARPYFAGHYQPHLPADLGFYDLRVRETRHEQYRLARDYGIDGFCYHFYWFSGTSLLRRPLDDMLSDRESDMPFCLCWANENWTRRWDGSSREVLIAQKHRAGDDVRLIESLLPYFADPRYIRLGGAPLLVVYMPQQLRDPKGAVATWREHCERVGVGRIHLCAALTHGNDDYVKFGFDSGVQFPPHRPGIGGITQLVSFNEPFRGTVLDYQALARAYLDRTYGDRRVFRTVVPSWDNTARNRNRAVIVWNGTPANYEYWLSEAVRRTREEFPSHERLVFINAWNEWAEGCHLEPDLKYQRQFLEATLRVKSGQSTVTGFADTALPEDRPSPRVLLDDLAKLFRFGRTRTLAKTRAWFDRNPKAKAVAKRVLFRP